MRNDKQKKGKNSKEVDRITKIETLNDLITLNLDVLSDVNDGRIDHRKASLIFTGSRTVTAGLKVGIDAMRLGLKDVGGMKVEKIAVEQKKE